MTADHKPAIIVISSHVVRGTVGNRAAVFALEVLGHNVWAVPTVILPWHPGHGPATRITALQDEFSALLKDLSAAPWLDEVGAVLSGYMANPAQAEAVSCLVREIKQQSPDLVFACDPVIGDDGGLYVAEETAFAIRDKLLPIADIITPNRFELGWLTEAGMLSDNSEILSAAANLNRPLTLVTSAHSMMRNNTGNVLLHPKGALLAEHRVIANPPNGLGDLTAALFLARYLQKQPLEKALQMTTSSVFEILARASKRGADELMLETDSASLSRPMAMVQMRSLVVS